MRAHSAHLKMCRSLISTRVTSPGLSIKRKRLAKHTVDMGTVARLTIGMSVSGGPDRRSEIGDTLDGSVGESGQDIGEVISNRDLEPAATFDNRQNRRHAGSSLLASDVDPVLSFMQILA
jgi:hypothetical protein